MLKFKQVEKVFGANHPDPMEIEKAKKVLKVSNALSFFFFFAFLALWLCSAVLTLSFKPQDHEQALVDAIAKLKDASDGESGNN